MRIPQLRRNFPQQQRADLSREALKRQFEAKLQGAELRGDQVGLRLLRAGLERLRGAVDEEDFLIRALEAYSQSLGPPKRLSG